MKSNKLMIGDWVMVAHGGNATHYAKVTALLTSGIIECLLDGCGVLCKSVEPIPITPEIIEKNGWSLWEIEGEYKCIDTPTLYGRKAPFGVFDNVCINFVHELQHALRLCGIEKEIIL